MDTISLENPMLSEDFSSETNDFVLRPASFVSFPTPSAIENIPFVAGFPKGILDNESRKRLEPSRPPEGGGGRVVVMYVLLQIILSRR